MANLNLPQDIPTFRLPEQCPSSPLPAATLHRSNFGGPPPLNGNFYLDLPTRSSELMQETPPAVSTCYAR